MHLRLRALLLSAALFVLAPALAPHAAAARAQVGSSTDILTGVVTGPGGLPVAGATVEATSVETQITRKGTTNEKGRYTILFPDGGGRYTLVVRRVGLTPYTTTAARESDEDRIVANVNLTQAPVQLSEVQVRARQAPRGPTDPPTPGSTERNINPDLAARLPIDAGDLNALATLAPGVVAVEGTDTTGAGFSVAGQSAQSNNITLDGLTAGSATVPQDAVRQTRVITNTYDAARGQFSGAQVASTTRQGTNRKQGSFTYSLRSPELAWEPGASDASIGAGSARSAFGRAYTQNQLGGGFGGPLIRNRLFAFGSAQGRVRSDPLQSLLAADPASLAQLGVSEQTLSSFLRIVSANGIPPSAPVVDDDRASDNLTALLRVDYVVSDAHSLMLRGDWRGSFDDPTRIGQLALPQTGGEQRGSGGGGMAALTSRFGVHFINEGRAYVSTDRNRTSSFLALPAGRVQVRDSSTNAISTLQFGGNPGLPQSGRSTNVELTDELSWMPGDASHRIKIGGLFNSSRFSRDVTNNRFGTFTFQPIDTGAVPGEAEPISALEALEMGRPASFQRTLTPRLRAGTAMNSGLYVADSWRRSRALQLTYGLRLEGSRFAGAPAYNPAVEEAFGYRTDRLPSEVAVTPRLGFSWTLGGSAARPGGNAGGPQQGEPGGEGRRRGGGGGGGGGGGRGGGRGGPGGFGPPGSLTVVRGGFGVFRGTFPTQLLAAAQGATGLSESEAQIVCTGDAVPTPDWAAYLADPSAIPTACLTTPTPQPGQTGRRANVTVFDPDFGAPRTWRTSLGVQRRVLDRWLFNAEASWARGTAQAGSRDLNLSAAPQFTLAGEDGRPVFVPAATIAPASGAVNPLATRRDPAFGQVLAYTSDRHTDQRQLTLSMNGLTRRGTILNLSYTLARTRDESDFRSPTAGDPNARGWATSDMDRRHQLLGTMTRPFGLAFELTAIGRLTSGSPLTPLVGSDINGDGSRNDRAFVFDPASTGDTALANGMARLLSAAPSSVRGCLRAQLGEIAGRNSCRRPWQPSLDLQANFRPGWLGLDRRLTLSLTTANLLGGLDYLLHGEQGLRGWAAPRQQDPVLLAVEGFDPDPADPHYVYRVNERFGATRGATLRVPFQLGLQARYVIGPDQTRDRIQALARQAGVLGGGGAGGPGGGPGAGGSPGDFASRFARVLPNPVRTILERRDSLALAGDQVTRLTVIADSLDARNGALAESMRETIQGAGANPDMAALWGILNPRLQQGRTNIQHALTEAQAILTPEQWARLPERVKNPRQMNLPGMGNAGGGGDRPRRP